MKLKFEYIWLDGYTPEPNLRSKTKVIESYTFFDEKTPSVEELPVWSYDGSSTKQAEGSKSDCLLKPVRLIRDPQRKNAYLVMCEVLNPDNTAHETNTRNRVTEDSNDVWFGFEQEYFIMDKETQLPLGFPIGGYPGPQGMYYCSVGGRNTHGRELVERHADLCLEAGINIHNRDIRGATVQHAQQGGDPAQVGSVADACWDSDDRDRNVASND